MGRLTDSSQAAWLLLLPLSARAWRTASSSRGHPHLSDKKLSSFELTEGASVRKSGFFWSVFWGRTKLTNCFIDKMIQFMQVFEP